MNIEARAWAFLVEFVDKIAQNQEDSQQKKALKSAMFDALNKALKEQMKEDLDGIGRRD